MKTCTKCGGTKALTDFSKRSKGTADGLRSQCKACDADDRLALRLRDPVAFNEKAREKYARNRERCIATSMRSHQKHRGRIRERCRARGYSRLHAKKGREELSDKYVVGLLAERSGMSRSSIPSELIEAKREHLRLSRLLKEKRRHEDVHEVW